ASGPQAFRAVPSHPVRPVSIGVSSMGVPGTLTPMSGVAEIVGIWYVTFAYGNSSRITIMAVDRSLEVRAVAAVFFALASVTTILRCYVRLAVVKAFGWDDGVMVLALLFYAMFSGCMIGGSLYGTGKHLTELTNHQRTTAMEYWFYCDIGYALASILCKISVSIFILRVTIDRTHRITVCLVGGIVVIAGLIFFIMVLVQCHPMSYFWNQLSTAYKGPGSCMNMHIIVGGLYAFSASSALFDLTIAILPILLVRKLNMKRDVKFAVAGLLGMACVASIAVFIRIPYIHTLYSVDYLWATTPIAIWSNIETGLGIFAGSMATLRPILRKFNPSTRGNEYTSDPWPSTRNKQRNFSVPLRSLDTNTTRTPPSEFDDRMAMHAHDERLYGTTMYSVETGERVDTDVDVADGGESGHGHGGRVDEYPILPKNGATVNGGGNGIGMKFPGIISVRREVLVTTSA
ncbi:hypothetical protein BO79DRAFT_157344, partial [Aspergillus costaricaensis CBS 115574]